MRVCTVICAEDNSEVVVNLDHIIYIKQSNQDKQKYHVYLTNNWILSINSQDFAKIFDLLHKTD